MKKIIQASILIMASFGAAQAADSLHEFKVKDIDGNDVALSDYKDKVVLVVNVASRCGYTRQYSGLQKLHEAYADRGVVVLGFPANNYGGQEPGTNEEIKTFCSTKYSVSFPMFSKVSVDGDDQAPLFRYLTSAENPDFKGQIRWNFEKILVGKDGIVQRRFRSGTDPSDEELTSAIEKALGA